MNPHSPLESTDTIWQMMTLVSLFDKSFLGHGFISGVLFAILVRCGIRGKPGGGRNCRNFMVLMKYSLCLCDKDCNSTIHEHS